MKVALATSHGRMAPCFAGAQLQIVDPDADSPAAETVPTRGWHSLGWGRELMRRDVGVLLCSGIDQATWAGIQGHGIPVIPDVTGEPARALAAWRSGSLRPPRMWPADPVGWEGPGRVGFGRGGRRRRYRGGR